MESLKEKLTDGIQSIFDSHGLNVEYETGDYESVICLDDAIACIEESEDITKLEEELQAKTDLLALVVVEKTGLVEENAELRKQLKDSHEWLGINAGYKDSPLCVNNEKLLNK